MIAALSGNVLLKDGNSLVVDVQGVGYLVTVTTGVLEQAREGEQLSLVVITEVRENDISLYGFASRQEREVFRLLKKVKGVGAKLGLGIVSALGAGGLLSAIGRQDITLLRKVPGVGKKTAERLIVELREQVGLWATEKPLSLSSAIVVEASDEILNGDHQLYDAVLALEKLGFDRSRAQKAVQRVVEATPSHGADAGALVRDALSYL